jgi:hypothetical protein
MYPEVISFDVTYGTNKEKRPLARDTVKNSNHKNIPFFNALLPSCASWVFRWIFHDVFPRLLSKTSISKLQLILVDKEQTCNNQIEFARHMKRLPNAQYRLCKWHKVSFNQISYFSAYYQLLTYQITVIYCGNTDKSQLCYKNQDL